MNDAALVELIRRGGVTGHESVNQPIILREFAVTVNHNGRSFDAIAVPHLEFVPDNRLWLELKCSNADVMRALLMAPVSPLEGELTIRENGVKFVVNWLTGGTSDDGISVSPRHVPLTVTPNTDRLLIGAFDLFNFPEIGCCSWNRVNGEQVGGYEDWRRLVLNSGGWTITIAPLLNCDLRQKSLKDRGGFIATHTGIIERSPEKEFSSQDLVEIGETLRNFLSLSLGRWCGPCFMIGLNASGEKCFEQWGAPWVDAGHWRNDCSWFDRDHTDILPSVFTGFMSLISEQHWKRTISESIYLYVRANSGGFGSGIDVGLIVAQAALERIAWTYFVVSKKMSRSAFKSQFGNAAAKIAALAEALDVPGDIPPEFPSLKGTRPENWQNIFSAVTSVRNEFVHPESKIQRQPGDALEAWIGSLWLLDLVFLRLCGYSGNYMQRFGRRTAGMVRPLPTRTGGP